MTTPLIAETEEVLRAAERLQRVGLIIDRSTLSPAFRRAWFHLQCQLAAEAEMEKPEARDSLIGFPYPTRDTSSGRP